MSGMKKLVSILIPAYNAEKWMDETIQSAKNQVWLHKEIIVVDDGSKDETYNIARRYESNTVKVIRQENKGACAARNAAFALAQGEYIQWLDADDVLAPDKISRQLEFFNHGEVDPDILLSSSFGKFYYSTKRPKLVPNRLWQDLTPVEYFLYKFNEGIWMNPAVFLVSRKITESAGPWNEDFIRDNDGEYFCRVVSVSKMIKFIPEARCFYRKGHASLVTNRSENALESMFLVRCLCIEYLLSLENSERTRSASLIFMQSMLSLLYPKRNNPRVSKIIENMNTFAVNLGGRLSPPKYKWKYAIIKHIFGQKAAEYMKGVDSKIRVVIRKKKEQLYHILT